MKHYCFDVICRNFIERHLIPDIWTLLFLLVVICKMIHMSTYELFVLAAPLCSQLHKVEDASVYQAHAKCTMTVYQALKNGGGWNASELQHPDSDDDLPVSLHLH